VIRAVTRSITPPPAAGVTWKIGTIAESPAIADTASGREASFAEFLVKLLAAEAEARDRRLREVLLKLAALPSLKILEQHDFAHESGAPRSQIMEPAAKVVLLAPSGVGKTHLASAYAFTATQAGM
jgi:DNA replication protein DnaC